MTNSDLNDEQRARNAVLAYRATKPARKGHILAIFSLLMGLSAPFWYPAIGFANIVVDKDIDAGLFGKNVFYPVFYPLIMAVFLSAQLLLSRQALRTLRVDDANRNYRHAVWIGMFVAVGTCAIVTAAVIMLELILKFSVVEHS